MTKTIIVPNVDISLLRQQRDAVLNDTHWNFKSNETKGELQGLINLLDNMLDIAENYNIVQEN